MLVFKSANTSSRAGLDSLVRDPLLTGAGGGVRFAFDTAFGFSYAGGPPADGAVIHDIAENADSTFQKASSQTVGYSGGGFDFSTMSQTANGVDKENNVLSSASVWADIWANQQFLFCTYVKLPTSGDFNSSTTLYPMFASSVSGYSSEADPLTLAQIVVGSTPYLQFRRQTAVGTAVSYSIDPSMHYGNVAQVAFWRNASGIGLRIKSSAGTTPVTSGVSSDSSANFTACRPRFGSVSPFTSYGTTAHQKARNYRLYRGFIENLYTSGRDPVSVLDADYARVIARNVFS